MHDLGNFTSAKASLARAKEINEGWQTEMVRLQVAVSYAVTLIACLLVVAGSFLFIGLPEQKRLDLVVKESGR